MKTITAFDVAEYFIFLSKKEKKQVSNKKLQKLVYYAQAWTLALTGKVLFSDKIEAWIHGPAIPSLYHKYKKYGFQGVKSENPKFNFKDFSNHAILDEVWHIYGKYDANYLELLTHQEEPWINARSELEFSQSSSNEISIESMKVFYKKKLKSTKSVQEKSSKASKTKTSNKR